MQFKRNKDFKNLLSKSSLCFSGLFQWMAPIGEMVAPICNIVTPFCELIVCKLQRKNSIPLSRSQHSRNRDIRSEDMSPPVKNAQQSMSKTKLKTTKRSTITSPADLASKTDNGLRARGDVNKCNDTERTVQSPATSVGAQLKNVVMSLIGTTCTKTIEPGPCDLFPPGLTNGSNVCFLNSIVQILLRSPLLDVCLRKEKDAGMQHLSAFDRQFMIEIINLLDCLTGKVEPDRPLFTCRRLRETACDVAGGLQVFVRPSEYLHQPQQDAAECLLWLLDVLHSFLNAKAPSRQKIYLLNPYSTLPCLLQ